MTTAEAIETIKDPGEFEILATRVLKLMDEDCRFIEHMGVNAEGKTIPSPIDGFCRVAGHGPSKFVMTAFTTVAKKSLEHKWLFDHTIMSNAKKTRTAKDGDLIKIFRLSESLRKAHPNAIFIAYLCTNRQPDINLMTKTLEQGEKLGLEVRFLTRSRLKDFLEEDPEGQWLRKEHLGIPANRLSLPLLRELSVKSLQQYGREFLIMAPNAFVSTASERNLLESINTSKCIYMVTGASGFGKSVCCYRVLQRHINNGGIGLWISGENIAQANSLEQVIELTLHLLYVTVEIGAGSKALRLGSPSKPLLLVIDDINHCGNPADFVRKIITWGNPLDNTKSQISQVYKMLVPVWDIYWASLEHRLGSTSWVTRIPLAKMDEDEALACLDASLGQHVQEIPDVERRQVVKDLGYDPTLIAMYIYSIRYQENINQPTVAIDIINRFVESAEREVVDAHPNGFLQTEYHGALLHLAIQMLTKRDLYPHWSDVQKWLQVDDLQAIRKLTRKEKICQVTNRGSDYIFEFRHDRLLEHFLAYAMKPMLSDPEENINVLSDPYYASFFGQILVSSQPSDSLLKWVQQHAPLALISSLNYIPALSNDLGNRIAIAVRDWINSAFGDEYTSPALLFEACRLLEMVDSPHILKITQTFARDRRLARARLANGDAAAGIIEFLNIQLFPPAVNDYTLDIVVGRAIHRHRQEIVKDCTEMLQKTDLAETERHAALILAGFIGDEALAVPIQFAWNLSKDKVGVLLPTLWAGFRCANSDPASILDELMVIWAGLPENGEGGHLSKRHTIAQQLQFSIQRGVPEVVLKYLIGKSRADEAIRWPITSILQHLNHPIAVAFLIEQAAEIERQIKGTKRFSSWLINLRDRWDPTTAKKGKCLSPDAIQVIRSAWKSEENDPQLRETAFSLWLRACDDLKALNSIPPDHAQFKSVLWRRAELGDISAASLIGPLIAVHQDWFHVIDKIWSEQFKDTLDKALLNLQNSTPNDYSGGTSNEHYVLARLLRDLPPNEAQPFILKHWGHLKFSDLFVQVALYIGSAECLKLASEAIDNYPDSVNPLKHVDMFFGFMDLNLMDRIKRHHLEVLIPYLKKLDDTALGSMAMFCERHGYHDWSKKHLKPEFDHRRALLPKVKKQNQEYIDRLGRRHYPSHDDLLEELDWIEQKDDHYHGHIYYWSEEFKKRQDEHVRWQHILGEWLSRKPTIERFRIVADAILEHGTRGDFDLLYKHAISGDPNEVERLQTNAKFGVMRRTLR